ncbi:hypothetical protein EGI26_11235 [Lacihabitans sp. CCS-44]|uniref:hypothetical protein n=1 Tax=Lacihabitans sp. CCS-44 TaxID=2487331 RepID=UPI0020CC8B77|nr:hypothetical protein [Lacihabitans sp. CCS-44]MCP9755729.1 hypothetical protein [Lacihabitans sp. CCS-44]
MKKAFQTTIKDRFRSFSPKTKTFIKLCAVMAILACGPSPMDYAEYFSLFYPENASTPAATKPYYFSTNFLNEEPYFYEETPSPKAETVEETENINAWEAYLKSKVSRDVIKSSLYGESKLSLLASKVSAFDKVASLYLVFAQEAEAATPHKVNYWEESPAVDSIKIVDLIDKADEGFQNATNDFLKERYLFQKIKLSGEIGRYDNLIDDFAANSRAIKRKSFISDWSKSRVAGATMALGDTANAVFMFAQIFNDCPSRRFAADLSVRRISPKFFAEALELATKSDEKANVLALQGIQPLQDGLEILDKIYDLNPKHPLLELVFAREINKNEMAFFAEKNSTVYGNFDNYYDDNYKIDQAKVDAQHKKGETYLEKLLSFSEKLSSDGKVENPPFWNLSTAYFLYLKNDTKAALELLNGMKVDGNAKLKKQVEFLTFEMMDKTPSDETEQKMLNTVASFTDIKEFRNNNLLLKMSETLANYYANKKEEEKSGWFWSCSDDKAGGQGNAVKAFLAHSIAAGSDYGSGYQIGTSHNALIDTCSSDFLQKLIAFTQSKDLNINDKKLVELSNLKPDYMNLALARRQVSESKFAEASETFKLVSAQTLTDNGFDENFESISNDIRLGSAGSEDSPKVFLEKLADLKTKVGEKNATAIDCYEYGKGLYNLSYYGQGWILTQRGKSTADLEYNDELKSDYYLTENARKAFEEALSLSPEKELAAKICYAGALCERNQYLVKYYSERPDDYSQEESYTAKMRKNELPKYRTFFTKLLKNYQDTQYQKMVLKECETYANFVK